jgi:hypothetical protein
MLPVLVCAIAALAVIASTARARDAVRANEVHTTREIMTKPPL